MNNKNRLKKNTKVIGIVLLFNFCFIPLNLLAERLVIEIEIINHFFVPDTIIIPPDTKVKLVIKNRDNTSEEFESYELNREKLVMGNKKINVFIGPLEKGKYPFFGEFNPKTAQGWIEVK